MSTPAAAERERPINVVHYGLSANTGGIETYLLTLATHIDRSQFHFDFVHTRAGTPCFHDELAALGAAFFPITPRRESPRRNRADLDAVFDSGRFDILHCHLNTLSYVAPIHAALRHGCRVVVHSHNSGAPDSRVTRLLHTLHSRTLPRERITTLAVSRLAGEWLFGRRAPFTVVNNGIDVERFRFDSTGRARLRRELGIEDRFVIGNVATFLYAKNHAFSVRVFAEVLRRRPDAVLLLVGVGALQDQTRAQVAELGLADSVRFLGKRDDVPTLLSAMDRLLFPSIYEGFPLAVLEAQAAGLPALISDAVTDEVVITDACWQLSLDDPPVTWAEALLSLGEGTSREGGADAVIAAGLSVEGVTRRVEQIYVDALA